LSQIPYVFNVGIISLCCYGCKLHSSFDIPSNQQQIPNSNWFHEIKKINKLCCSLLSCFATCTCQPFIIALPSCILMPCFPPLLGTSWPTPHCCFVALLLYLVSWYSLLTFLCKWRSLEQHQQASSNNMFFFLNFSSFFFFFLYVVCFCFSVVCQF
jgi:hypothetical protein